MTDLDFAAALASLNASPGRPAPVDSWNPPFCGSIDIRIRRDGVWLHEGEVMRRPALVVLFSRVLKREGDAYFLVTPAEKLQITVEDAPFLATELSVDGEGPEQYLTFTTNVGDQVIAGAGHALRFNALKAASASAPYVHVRRDLWARLTRPVYYALVELAQTRHEPEGDQFGVWSAGEFFSFGPAAEILDDL